VGEALLLTGLCRGVVCGPLGRLRGPPSEFFRAIATLTHFLTVASLLRIMNIKVLVVSQTEMSNSALRTRGSARVRRNFAFTKWTRLIRLHQTKGHTSSHSWDDIWTPRELALARVNFDQLLTAFSRKIRTHSLFRELFTDHLGIYWLSPSTTLSKQQRS
jgi:hypothetical protein